MPAPDQPAPAQPPPAQATQDVAPQWQMTMWTMVAVQVIMTLSFTFLSPVMPLFLPHLGVETEEAIDLWSGALSSVTSLIAAIAAPMWGRLSDRTGRKVMVLRSALAIGLLTIMMAFAQNVWHMLGLRILMGAGAGFSAASVVLIASQVPGARLGYALGMLDRKSTRLNSSHGMSSRMPSSA